MRRDYGAHRVRRGEAGRTVRGLCTVIKKSRWWKTRENCQQPSRRLVTEGSACAQCPVPGGGSSLPPGSGGGWAGVPLAPGFGARDAATPGLPSEPEANFISVFSSHVGGVEGKHTMSRGERPLPWAPCTNKYPVLSP